MKKFMLALSAIALAATFTGCATSKASKGAAPRNASVAEFDQFIEESRDAEEIEKTGVEAIDLIADASTAIYKKVGVAMRKYAEELQGDLTVSAVSRAAVKSFQDVEPEVLDDFDPSDDCYCGDVPLTEEEDKERTEFLKLRELYVAIQNVLDKAPETVKEGKDYTDFYKLARDNWSMNLFANMGKAVDSDYKAALKEAEADKKAKAEEAKKKGEKAEEKISKEEDQEIYSKCFKARFEKLGDQKKFVERGMELYAEKLSDLDDAVDVSMLEKIGEQAKELFDRAPVLLKDTKKRAADILAGLNGVEGYTDYIQKLGKLKTALGKSAEQKAADIEALNKEYAPTLEKVDVLQKQAEELKNAAAVLGGGVMKQLKYTTKAVPKLMSAINDTKEMGGRLPKSKEDLEKLLGNKANAEKVQNEI